MALIDKLTAIGDAIRGKEGTTDLIPLNDMATRITNLPSGGGGNEPTDEELVLSGKQQNRFAYGVFDWVIEKYGNRITTKDLNNCSYMFFGSTVERIPFDLNFEGGTSPYSHLGNMFEENTSLLEIPNIYNAYPESISTLFKGCYKLRNVPDDFFDTWNFNRIKTYAYAPSSQVFYNCYALRKLPTSFFKNIDDQVSTSGSYVVYSYMCSNCLALDEITDIPVFTATYTGQMFSGTFSQTMRLKKLTFAVNDDGTPKTANWKGQIIDLSLGIGYPSSQTYTRNLLTYSGITSDKEVNSAETYQALKNDPDWYTTSLIYSRYNHDSAVETINSLPDTSAYLASAGGTNTIKFKGESGRETDGGAINTLTEEEIAVATAKGWTVTLS